MQTLSATKSDFRFKTMRALITGADGFTGNYLADALRIRGFFVTGLFRTEPQSEAATEHFDHVIVADLLDEVQLATAVELSAPTVAAHLAAISSVDHANVSEMYETNIVGTRSLLKQLHKFAPRISSILLASSANIYGNSAELFINENTPLSPANDYGVSKLAMEYLAKTWFDKLPITIVRPFNYTGVGQSDRFVIPKIVNHFVRRVPEIELGNVSVFRDYSDVRDVAEAYAQLLTHPKPNQTFNVASGVATSLQELIDALAQITGHSIEVKVNPNFIRKDEIISLRGDDSRLRNAVELKTKKRLNETLSWMVSGGGQ